jgi:hypothetical protein
VRTYQLSHLRKIALALVCVCLFTSACQGDGRSPINVMQKIPSVNGISQSYTLTQGPVVKRQNGSTPSPTLTVTPTPIPTTNFNSGSPFYFAMGSEPDGALRTPLVQEAPVKMLTSWHASHNDLSWITTWHSTYIPCLYARGYALQLVVCSGGPLVNFNTSYGPAGCWRGSSTVPE